MHFREEAIPEFLENFERHRHDIRNFAGCQKLQLLQEIENPAVYFTYSWWESDAALQEYRQSTLFRGVWKTTKSFFDREPMAWSLHSKVEL